MKKLICLLSVLTCGTLNLAEAQQTKKIPLIGFLEGASISESQGIEPFREGLRKLGYVDGQNIIFEIRAMEGKPDRIPGLIEELLRSKVDVIFTPITPAAQAAKKVAPTIPIVVVVEDPVSSGLVMSLARPDGNVTGLSGFAELAGKRLEILKDALPNVNRVAVFWNPSNAPSKVQLKETEDTAHVLGVKIQALEVDAPEGFESAFKSAIRERAGALIAVRSPMLVNNRKKFLKLAADNRLPGMYDDKNFVEPGRLMSYGPDRADLFRRAATYVDKILKGAKPPDLPVEQPTKFELVINLKTAKEIGVTIAQGVLIKADRVIQ